MFYYFLDNEYEGTSKSKGTEQYSFSKKKFHTKKEKLNEKKRDCLVAYRPNGLR
jgi:hypothetical protein